MNTAARRFSQILAIAVAACYLAGCKRADPRFVGTWKATLDLSGFAGMFKGNPSVQNNPSAAAALKSFSNMSYVLDLRGDKSFRLTMPEAAKMMSQYGSMMPNTDKSLDIAAGIEGNWDTTGNALTLNTTKIYGKTVAELKAENEKTASSMQSPMGSQFMSQSGTNGDVKPMALSLSADGQSISFPGNQALLGSFVFKKQ